MEAIPTMAGVVKALKKTRSSFAPLEAALHIRVGEALRNDGYIPVHEAVLGGGCRVDYLVGSIAVEIKKDKPNAAQLRRQIERYLASPLVTALVVVSERRVSLPAQIMGKPVAVVVLNRLWGVALP